MLRLGRVVSSMRALRAFEFRLETWSKQYAFRALSQQPVMKGFVRKDAITRTTRCMRCMSASAGSSARVKHVYKCRECHEETAQWSGQCMSCQSWGTYVTPCCIMEPCA